MSRVVDQEICKKLWREYHVRVRLYETRQRRSAIIEDAPDDEVCAQAREFLRERGFQVDRLVAPMDLEPGMHTEYFRVADKPRSVDDARYGPGVLVSVEWRRGLGEFNRYYPQDVMHRACVLVFGTDDA